MSESNITRIGVSLPSDLLNKFDLYIEARQYTNRSEAIRDLIRDRLVQQDWEMSADKEVAGTITYVYDHHKRELLDEIVNIQHDYSQHVLAAQHIHLDHHNCLEAAVVKGTPATLFELTNKLTALKGIKHCKLVMTTTGAELS